MRRARRPSWPTIAAVVLPALSSVALPAAAQVEREPAQADTVAPADTVAAADTTRFPVPVVDPRITILGDTLGPADTLWPRFSQLPEVWPDSLVDPYSPDRPGSTPAWVLSGDQLLGRGAQSLLDVLESEAIVLPQDLGGGGVAAYLGSPVGTATNVQVVVDGLPAGTPLSASWDLRQIPLEAIARVAWYPGPGTALWGGEGSGGVLSITTRRSLAPSARSLLALSVGSFDSEAFGGYLARPVTDRGDAFFAANFDATDGLERTGDFTRNQIVARLGWRIGEDHRLEVSRLSDGFSGEASRTGILGSQDQDAALLHGFYAGRAGPLSWRGHGYRAEQDLNENFDYREGADGLVGEGRRSGWSGDVEARTGAAIAWAAAAREEAEVSSAHPAFLRTDDTSILEPDADDPDAPRVVNPRRTTEWGGGLGYGEPGGLLAGHVALRRIDYGDAAEPGTSWSAGLVGRPGAGVTLRASAGRSARPAEPMGQAVLARLAGQGIQIHPGREADPRALEEWTSVRGGVAWSGAGWRVSAAAWRATGDRAFLWLPPSAWLYFDPADFDRVRLGGPRFNTFDVVDLEGRGFEAGIDLPLPWDLRGLLRIRRSELTRAGSGEHVPYVPRTQALGQLRWAGRFFPNRDLLVEARLAGRYSGERRTLDGGVLADYLVGDALLQATIINFTIFVSFRNLAGQVVRTEEAFALPGREGHFGVNWRFRN